ncbi:MAG: SDR family NAD(P)-dependent oxidoreductase [Ardenticatenaceae bacterium]|nr:SDR family NAD(P)-dependent oxidoreductase [Ardenticatenaceae bacterium]
MELNNDRRVENSHLPQVGLTLKGKVALVLGPDSDNGRSLIRNLAAKGSDIVLVCINGITQAVLRLQAEVEALGRRCLVVVGDVRSWRFSQQLMTQIMQAFGHLDIFIDFSAQTGELEEKEKTIFPNAMMMTAVLKQMVA